MTTHQGGVRHAQSQMTIAKMPLSQWARRNQLKVGQRQAKLPRQEAVEQMKKWTGKAGATVQTIDGINDGRRSNMNATQQGDGGRWTFHPPRPLVKGQCFSGGSVTEEK